MKRVLSILLDDEQVEYMVVTAWLYPGMQLMVYSITNPSREKNGGLTSAWRMADGWIVAAAGLLEKKWRIDNCHESIYYILQTAWFYSMTQLKGNCN